MPVVFAMSPNATVPLPALPGGCTGATLPPGLVIRPATICFAGAQFSLHRSGLYRFFRASMAAAKPGSLVAEQRLVFGGRAQDVAALLSGIAWMTTHGTRHASLKPPQLQGVAKQEKIVVDCGVITKFAMYLLAQHCAHLPSVRFRKVVLLATLKSSQPV